MSFGTFNSVWNFGLYCVTIYCSSLWFKSGELMSCLVQDSFVWHAFKREICLIFVLSQDTFKSIFVSWNMGMKWAVKQCHLLTNGSITVLLEGFECPIPAIPSQRKPLASGQNGTTARYEMNCSPSITMEDRHLLHEDVFYYNIDWPGSHLNK